MIEGLTDAEIEDRLRAASEDAWQAVWDAAAAVAAEEAHGVWGGGEKVLRPGPDGELREVTMMPYVEISPNVDQLILAIGGLGASEAFDWLKWEGLTRYPLGVGLSEAPVAESIRMVMAVSRSNRFSEGATLAFADAGGYDHVVARLRHWHDHER